MSEENLMLLESLLSMVSKPETDVNSLLFSSFRHTAWLYLICQCMIQIVRIYKLLYIQDWKPRLTSIFEYKNKKPFRSENRKTYSHRDAENDSRVGSILLSTSFKNIAFSCLFRYFIKLGKSFLIGEFFYEETLRRFILMLRKKAKESYSNSKELFS